MQDADAVQQVIDENAQQGYALTWVPEPDQETEEETEANYTVYVVDQNGSPVPGAMINFCTDESCQFFQSDFGRVSDPANAFDGERFASFLYREVE